MKNLITSIFAVLILTGSIIQAQKNKPIPAPCKYISQSGWRVPCLGEVAETESLKDSVVENIVVQAKKHILVAENLVGVEMCQQKGKETKEARNRQFAVRDFVKYEAHEKVFAYRIRFTYFVVERDNSIVYAGAQYNAYYFDEDGDGTFEIRCQANGLEDLPAWVKVTAQSKQ